MPMIWVEQDVYDELQDLALIHDFTEIQVLDDILRGHLIPMDLDEQDLRVTRCHTLYYEG